MSWMTPIGRFHRCALFARCGSRRQFFRETLAALAVLIVCAGPALSQNVEDLCRLSGAERTKVLADGARKEGTVTLYTSLAPEDVAILSAAFEKEYGVKVVAWRGSGENVIQRADAENRAGRLSVDVFEAGDRQLEVLHRLKILQRITAPTLPDILPRAIPAHGEWVGTRLNAFAAAYNTDLVKKAELPKSYEDLTDPKWKGRLGIEAEDYDWFQTVVEQLGEEKGLALFKTIAQTNGLSVRKGHTLLTNLVAAGEVPLSLTNYPYKPEQLKRKGAPIDWFFIPPAIARVNGIGLAREAPHPHAAVLFVDFMLSEGQTIMAKRQFWVTNQKASAIASHYNLIITDTNKMIDENDKWQKLFNTIVVSQSRQ
jgi:iron(III) transport system substrate-binding protein